MAQVVECQTSKYHQKKKKKKKFKSFQSRARQILNNINSEGESCCIRSKKRTTEKSGGSVS
jgi:hypothetical protein